MLRYIVNRLLLLLVVVWIIITVTFFLLHSIPGGPFDTEKTIPDEVKRNIEARYKLDDPLIKQYVDYLFDVVQLDLGPSYKYLGRSVNDLIREGFPKSAIIGIISILTDGYSPLLTAITLFQKGVVRLSCSSGEPCGTLFSALQLTAHVWQPVHLSRSITMPHRVIAYALYILTLVLK